ncbi:Cof-type HAD-IIB family hydrolase [Oceanobacillus jeddahense]|uniref:Cof-type HAD-IIB family hydrolase n=1 Tax=Oceanobacillus jeddahense TaxID=1462527 RepID=A0ABY5JVI8_9BACI|nr:Cof-type HAD-IIB family hydrolase [Oceanobacillus jeddahense]UUI03086.1 Cof-type HAD-IIB family hydrolase [Oceanobacillus jeddahense]
MTKRPVVFFDLDGTLLTSENKVAQSSIKAIEKLIENDGIPVLATGRPAFETKEIRAETGIGSAVLMNGQFIVHEGEVISRNRINPVQLKKLGEYATQRGVTLSFHTAEQIFTTNNQSELLQKDCQYCDREIPEVDDDIYMNKPVYQVEIYLEEGEEEYQEKFPELHFVRNSPYNCDVFPQGVSKATGIKEFLELTGLPKENTYAFGDGLNDLEMFEFVKTSVAMGNSVEEIKEAATYVTKSADDDGVAEGLKMCGLIDQEESEKAE